MLFSLSKNFLSVSSVRSVCDLFSSRLDKNGKDGALILFAYNLKSIDG